jgi:hypothetical protein
LRTVRAVVNRIALLSLLCLIGAAPAAAQDEVCPSGNLLAGKSPTARPGVTQAKRLTDGVVAGEGDPWQSEFTSVLAGTESHVLYDLGATTRVTAIDLQITSSSSPTTARSSPGCGWVTRPPGKECADAAPVACRAPADTFACARRVETATTA